MNCVIGIQLVSINLLMLKKKTQFFQSSSCEIDTQAHTLYSRVWAKSQEPEARDFLPQIFFLNCPHMDQGVISKFFVRIRGEYLSAMSEPLLISCQRCVSQS
jgi:hypothetical protein